MSKAQHTPEAEALADAVLRAAGSGLRYYSMAMTREAILAAAQEGIDKGRADLLEACRYALGHMLESEACKNDDALWSCVSHFVRAIEKARGTAA